MILWQKREICLTTKMRRLVMIADIVDVKFVADIRDKEGGQKMRQD